MDGEYFSSNLGPWRVSTATIPKHYPETRGMFWALLNMWQGCLICMGYIYFDHRVSRDPSVKPICIFVKKYISPLGKKYEKVWKYLKRRWTTEPGMCIITIHRRRRGRKKGEDKEDEEKRVKSWKLFNWRRLAPCLCNSQFTGGKEGVKTRPLSLGKFGLHNLRQNTAPFRLSFVSIRP